MNVQVEILWCKGAKHVFFILIKYIIWGWGSWMGYLQMGYVQVQWSVSCSDIWCLKIVRVIWVSSFSDFSSCWQQRTGRKGGQSRILLWWETSEIYLMERVLRVGAAMVTSELRTQTLLSDLSVVVHMRKIDFIYNYKLGGLNSECWLVESHDVPWEWQRCFTVLIMLVTSW
jgi:hypothetical protein